MSRPAVVHLGRIGDVAGGMTQVLNGYLAWSFPRVDVEVLTTRGEPHDLHAGLTAAPRAAAALRQRDPASTVVVAHLSYRGSFVREGALLRLAAARGMGTVAHLHGSSFARFAARHPGLTGWVLRAADRVVSLSDESTEVAARFVPRERVVLVPNAIPPGNPGAKEDLAVFGGAVSHRKGVDVLLAAWEQAAAPGWELVVAGPVRDPEVVREGVPGVRFAGALPHAELMALLDRSRVAVLPSREEAMPMFVLEAMARENCVVSTDVGGIAAVLGGGRGVVVPAGDVGALRTALAGVLTDAALRDRLAAAGRAAFDAGYSAATVFTRVEDLWLAALADGARRRDDRARRRAA